MADTFDGYSAARFMPSTFHALTMLRNGLQGGQKLLSSMIFCASDSLFLIALLLVS